MILIKRLGKLHMKKKLAIFGAVCGVAIVGVVAAACSFTPKTSLLPDDNHRGVVEETGLKRIYVVLNDETWSHDSVDGDLWIYAEENDNLDDEPISTIEGGYNDAPKMHLIGRSSDGSRDDGYGYGLYYFDLKNEYNYIQIKNFAGEWQDGYNAKQTAKTFLGMGSEYNALWIEKGEDETAVRNINFGYVPALTSEQLAHVLSHEFIDSCSPNVHNGYGAWKQLEKIFISQNLGDIDMDTVVDAGETVGEKPLQTTLGELINALAVRSGNVAPEYLVLYFEDASWWQGYDVSTSIYAYGPNDANNGAWPGVVMTHLRYDSDTSHNFWGIRLDVSLYTNIQFVRAGYNNGILADWNARTADLSLADIPSGMNMYSIVNSTASWYDNNPDNVVPGNWTAYVG